MNVFSGKTCCLFIAAALSILPGCATMEKNSAYSSEQVFTGTVSEKIKSPDSLDRAQTYEVYFKPDKPVSCMMIGLTGRQNEQGLTGTSRPLKIFFMVDRLVDISRYGKNDTKFVHTELAKNYNKDWEQTREISLCSKENDPMMQVNSGSRYRIRFTTFTSGKYEYTVTFKSDCQITFWEQ